MFSLGENSEGSGHLAKVSVGVKVSVKNRRFTEKFFGTECSS